MARYTGAVCRLCRREGTKLFLKGTKCFPRSARSRSAILPLASMARTARRRLWATACSCAKSRRQAHLLHLESQFRAYYEKATRAGVTGELLIQQLERRLDNVAFRLGLAHCRAARLARSFATDTWK